MLFGKKTRRIVKLLIVEDEPLVAFDTEHFLREESFEIVATVDRVVHAMAVLEGEDEVDLLLVDVNLADGSGLDVARAAHAAGIPVIFVTGDCPPGADEVGVGFLSKPYAQKSLLGAISAVEALLDGKPPKRLPSGFQLFGAA
ncbi:response regulator [Sphingomonas qilianensis]|uniref:Response regulator n=1 Tax=Sphingomonas qilianensis TaxID=1736690 RepID=A0ABU9XVD0_9SPHN